MKFDGRLFYFSLTILLVLAILSLVPENLLPGGQREQTTQLEVPEGAEAGEL
jgi:hypothetical protein